MRKLRIPGTTTVYNYSIRTIIFSLITAMLLLFINGCSSPSQLTSWKDVNHSPTSLNKILVIGIVHDSLAEVRKNVEEHFVQAFKAMGYNAEASLEAFGQNIPSRFDQENTYINLCNQGIDAVLTVALLDKKKATKTPEVHTQKNTSAYFYNRILSYHAVRANPAEHIDPLTDQTVFIWEATLFNLSTLAPLYWVQTQPFAPTSTLQNHTTYSQIILSNLRKQKVLNKRSLVRL